MKILYNPYLPFRGYAAINLFGIILAREECKPLSRVTLNHEAIHTAQMKELLYVGFYLWYIIEWFIKLFISGKKPTEISRSNGKPTPMKGTKATSRFGNGITGSWKL